MWEYEFDPQTDETTIYWVGDSTTESATISGEISEWQNEYPDTTEAREAVADIIQSAGNPERIRMQFDLNYGFEER